jgi:hypothetical protein
MHSLPQFSQPMRTLLYMFFVIPSIMTSLAQTISPFHVTDTLLTDATRNRIERVKKSKKAMFEDDNYEVTRTCSGEWGGTIKFRDKVNGVIYACEATCPASVLRTDKGYIITSSLAHMTGFTEIVRISNPKLMDRFQLPPPRGKKGKTVFRYVGDDESKSKKGTETLIDSMGVLALGSFLYDGGIFHVVTDFKKTYVAQIDNKKFVIVDFLCNERTRSYDNNVITTDDGHTIISIDRGYIDIFREQVKLLRFR